MNNYYKYYELEKLINSRCKSIIDMFQNSRNMSIRMCADNLMISKSSVSRYIHVYIKERYPEYYIDIQHRLRDNSKNLCKPRKYWR